MEVRLTPDQQNHLFQLASEQGRAPGALAQGARFTEAVKLGEEALERGEYLTHEQVGERLERLFKS